MSIPLAFYNVIIPKSVLDRKYKGGSEQFRGCWRQYEEDGDDSLKDLFPFQEDEHLMKIGFMGYNEVREYIDELVENGLSYDKENKRSDDFCVVANMAGSWWHVDWLEFDAHKRHCWYIPVNRQVYN